jgi:hypothetical protein
LPAAVPIFAGAAQIRPLVGAISTVDPRAGSRQPPSSPPAGAFGGEQCGNQRTDDVMYIHDGRDCLLAMADAATALSDRHGNCQRKYSMVSDALH